MNVSCEPDYDLLSFGIYSDAQPWASFLEFYFRGGWTLLLIVKACQKWSLSLFSAKGFLDS
jgi:hypothetical protein